MSDERPIEKLVDDLLHSWAQHAPGSPPEDLMARVRNEYRGIGPDRKRGQDQREQNQTAEHAAEPNQLSPGQHVRRRRALVAAVLATSALLLAGLVGAWGLGRLQRAPQQADSGLGRASEISDAAKVEKLLRHLDTVTADARLLQLELNAAQMAQELSDLRRQVWQRDRDLRYQEARTVVVSRWLKNELGGTEATP